MPPIDISLTDEQATRRLGQDLALALQPGDCLALRGDLGAGKSTLARAIIRCLADDDALDVPSPTFTLVQSYGLRIAVSHLDLYRISDPDELEELGLDEALEDGAALIEWPERAGGQLPADTAEIALTEEEGNARRVSVTGPQSFMDRFGRSRLIRAFLDKSGFADADRVFFSGDASTRVYEQIRTAAGEHYILMNAPERLIGPVLKDGKRYAQIAHVAEDIRPFVAIAGFLSSGGFRAPSIKAGDLDAGLLVLEDLGSTLIADKEGRPLAERWEAAIDCLAALHRLTIPASLPVPGEAAHDIPPFDRDAMLIEVELLPRWYLPHRLGEAALPAFETSFHAAWDDLIKRLSEAEKSLILRDFHSPNILWQDDEEGIRRVGLIDFQDAMIGPAAYDVASLVQDARVTVAPELHDRLVDHYETARQGDTGFDPAGFREALAIMEAQRATKILGLFIRLKQRDGKPGYMRHLPRIEAYLRQALAHPVLSSLRACYAQLGLIEGES
ncbi:tRNA (adenosine(37)-N6)-threonylcarbamoyltransferase complex ATPase subunit type 1 TsaE [Hoeflea prorocentri]|uniref:tRNA threonylcarbamoyladenosine biosynthesis protein TsaE n=1 Tax=Hoeflea prorocentri TaxID=1922333 RepID=A0A9X3ZJI2_9HYPH|nr:tRNA (adenosine(37)-N6)-threonylcarbamoyltransferase complex ATPase subunit type 1 TsaE [Hoeflea prorocentri]MCY6383128.1 tRNA (adenosine(37)-N6)-threonylcarbamoyltransferase complex ATPase subunit type 1 TsaE [Hoeflea prorocentri]MDA5400928.1 tRNA (adenosine(37)-N6)-threonylcarbamoyltransferase complex ATPase subunit type 1 TsaE [Hoeflea prorocentri]